MLYCDVVYSSLSCTIVTVSATDGWSNDTLAIYHTNRLSLLRYRYLQDGTVCHVQPITPGHGLGARCKVTAMERDTSCGRSVVGTSSAVHSADSAGYIFTHR